MKGGKAGETPCTPLPMQALGTAVRDEVAENGHIVKSGSMTVVS